MFNPEKFEKRQEEEPWLVNIWEDLRKEGIKKKDIEIAMALGERLSYLDRKIFPENPLNIEIIADKDVDNNYVAFCQQKDDEKKMSYAIWAKDLYKRFKSAGELKTPIFSPKENYKIKKEKYLNKEHLYFSIASHEISHHLQREGKIKKFFPRDAESTSDPLLKAIIESCEREFEKRRKIYRQNGASEKFIKEKLSLNEFDARIRQLYVSNKTYQKIEELGDNLSLKEYEEIAQWVQIAPERTE